MEAPSLGQREAVPLGAMSLERYFAALVDYYEPLLPRMAWVTERQRWSELLFCLLWRFRPEGDAPQVRAAVETMTYLGLTDFERLAGAFEDAETQTAIRVVLTAHGFSRDDADRGVEVLITSANQWKARFGSPPAYLDRVGQLIVEELMPLFDGLLPEAEARGALVTWLQNTLNLPMLLENRALANLQTSYGISRDDLINAADRAGVNFAILDDLATLAAGDDEFAAFLQSNAASPGGTRDGR